MKEVAAYLAPLVAFAATFIGLLGPSRRPDKVGFEAVTTYGWLACALAAVSLCVALYVHRAKQAEVEAGRAAQKRMRAIVNNELMDGLNRLGDVLRYAALMPYETTPTDGTEAPAEIPYAAYRASHRAFDIDLRSDEVIDVLQHLYLAPTARLKSPSIPIAVPFGTDLTRSSFEVIVDESKASTATIDNAVQKYAVVALTAETIEAASELVRSPFLRHLSNLRKGWDDRSRMEDSSSARALGFRFLDSGLAGASTRDYVELVGRIDRLSMLLTAQAA